MKNTIITLLLLSFLFSQAQTKKYQIAEGLIEYQDLFNTSMNPDVSCYRIPAIVMLAGLGACNQGRGRSNQDHLPTHGNDCIQP